MVVVCKKKEKKPHPAWVFLRKMPEKQSILFAWPKQSTIYEIRENGQEGLWETVDMVTIKTTVT